MSENVLATSFVAEPPVLWMVVLKEQEDGRYSVTASHLQRNDGEPWIDVSAEVGWLGNKNKPFLSAHLLTSVVAIWGTVNHELEEAVAVFQRVKLRCSGEGW